MHIGSYMSTRIHTGVTSNTDRIAKHIGDWLIAEEMCDVDMANHVFCRKTTPLSDTHLLGGNRNVVNQVL